MKLYNFVEKTFMTPYSKAVASYCNKFECGDQDLDEYFEEDAFLYEKELLGKTYCWIDKQNKKDIIAIATLSYDGIKTNSLDKSSRNALQRKIPYNKHHRSYPAVLIGRLGVDRKFQGQGLKIGTQLLELLKYWFLDESNKAACRYLLVDAYNSERTLCFYERNGFKMLYKTEEREREAFHVERDRQLNSRIMYFDLKTFIPSTPEESDVIFVP